MLVVGLEVAERHGGEGPSGGRVHVLLRVRLQRAHAEVPEVDLQEGGEDEELADVVEQEEELGQQVHRRQVAAHAAAHAQLAARQRLLQQGRHVGLQEPVRLAVDAQPLLQEQRHLLELLLLLLLLGKQHTLQHLHHLDDVAARVGIELPPHQVGQLKINTFQHNYKDSVLLCEATASSLWVKPNAQNRLLALSLYQTGRQSYSQMEHRQVVQSEIGCKPLARSVVKSIASS